LSFLSVSSFSSLLVLLLLPLLFSILLLPFSVPPSPSVPNLSLTSPFLSVPWPAQFCVQGLTGTFRWPWAASKQGPVIGSCGHAFDYEILGPMESTVFCEVTTFRRNLCPSLTLKWKAAGSFRSVGWYGPYQRWQSSLNWTLRFRKMRTAVNVSRRPPHHGVFFLFSLGVVRLSPLGTSATVGILY
jgi:hypothetical protein